MTREAFALQQVVLLAITDLERVPPEQTLERAARIARSARPGTVAFQLRDFRLSARALLAFGERLRDAVRAEQQAFVVNDRLDLALLLDADAVHLGERSVSSAAARRLVGALPVSRACHGPESIGGVDAELVVLSPILETRKGRPALGLSALQKARARLASGDVPRLFALGGIDAARAEACLATGAHGVAAIGAAFAVADATPLLAALRILR